MCVHGERREITHALLLALLSQGQSWRHATSIAIRPRLSQCCQRLSVTMPTLDAASPLCRPGSGGRCCVSGTYDTNRAMISVRAATIRRRVPGSRCLDHSSLHSRFVRQARSHSPRLSAVVTVRRPDRTFRRGFARRGRLIGLCGASVDDALLCDADTQSRSLADGSDAARAGSSPCLRRRQYNCVRVIPNRRAAFDLFPSVSRSACSIACRSTSDS